MSAVMPAVAQLVLFLFSTHITKHKIYAGIAVVVVLIAVGAYLWFRRTSSRSASKKTG